MTHADIVIIGSGFAGSSVASQLRGRDVLFLDRGEKPVMDELYQKFDASIAKERRKRALLALETSLEKAYVSKHNFNHFYPLAKNCISQYVMIGDGTSNHWEGRVLRLAPSTFNQEQEIRWPFSYNELVPYYEKAEKLLNISGDQKIADTQHYSAFIAGTEYWHDLLAPYFPKAHAIAVAKNLNPNATNSQNMCCGAGRCVLCPNDAKARPETIFDNRHVRYETLVEEILFEGDRATQLRCQTIDGEEIISFNQLIIAAHAVESVKLLKNSRLPKKARKQYIGKFYQDHSTYKLGIRFTKPVAFRHLNSNTAIYLPELSGVHENIHYFSEIMPFLPGNNTLRNVLDTTKLQAGNIDGFFHDFASTLEVSTTFEIPPELGLSIEKTFTGKMRIKGDSQYQSLLPIYESIIQKNHQFFQEHDIEIFYTDESYKKKYGYFHIMGTLNMSPGETGVTDENCQLIGTENVFVAGSSLFPRSGAHNPTLTIVALGMRLGEHLASQN